MKTDLLDVVQLHHGPRTQALDQEGTLAALIELREKGQSDSRVEFSQKQGRLLHRQREQ